MKVIYNENFDVAESVLFLGNGNLGIRNNLEENHNYNRGTYLNGFYDVHKIEYDENCFGFSKEGEEMIPVFDGQEMEIYIDDEMFNLDSGSALNHERVLDMEKGIYTRNIVWLSPKGVEVIIKIEKIISFVHQNLFLTRVSITTSPDAFIRTITRISREFVKNYDVNDPRQSHGTKSIEIVKNDLKNKFLKGSTKNLKNEVFLNYDFDCNFDTVETNNGIDICIENNGELFFVKQLSYNSKTIDVTFDEILYSQRKYLEKFWAINKISISGDEKLELGMNFNIYSLLQSTPGDGKRSIAAKGLSGDGYKGHYFWDSEMYVFPVFLWTNRKLAKSLLEYRYSILDNAITNARNVGYKEGALFPWRTIAGRECSSFFEAGMAQHHINGDIAYAFIEYYNVTRDLQFMIEKGIEVILQTARLFNYIGHEKDGQFHIDMVTGPDEYSCLVNDNYYTNMLAKYNMENVVKILEDVRFLDEKTYDELIRKLKITKKEITEFMKHSKIMAKYKDEKLNITCQDRDFLNKKIWDFKSKKNHPLLINYHPLDIYRHQVSKQADVVFAHFLREEEVDFEELCNTVNYYDKITTHDSSLSFSIYSIMFNRIGNTKKAFKYFNENVRLDLDNTHHNTKDGIHTAAQGGSWMGIVYGFFGLRLIDNKLHFTPNIPDEFGEVEFKIEFLKSLISISGRKKTIKVTCAEQCDIEIICNKKILKILKT